MLRAQTAKRQEHLFWVESNNIYWSSGFVPLWAHGPNKGIYLRFISSGPMGLSLCGLTDQTREYIYVFFLWPNGLNPLWAHRSNKEIYLRFVFFWPNGLNPIHLNAHTTTSLRSDAFSPLGFHYLSSLSLPTAARVRAAFSPSPPSSHSLFFFLYLP